MVNTLTGDRTMNLNLEELFKKHSEEFLKFDRIIHPLHIRPEICAFLLLHHLAPENKGEHIIGHAERGEVFLNFDLDVLETNAGEADIITLIRCGVCINEFGCLVIYV